MDCVLVESSLVRSFCKNRIVLFSPFRSCSVPGPLVPVIRTLGSALKPPFPLQQPPLAAPQSRDNPRGTNSFQTKMRLHAPGVVSFRMQARLVFSSWQYLTSESLLLSPARLRCGEMQGNLMVPQPLLLSRCPASAGRRRGFISLKQQQL